MMISGQGTDTYNSLDGTYTAKGTFSGQDGGITKTYNNIFENSGEPVYQSQHSTQFDAFLVSERNEQIPYTTKSLRGNFAYTNFDTSTNMYESTPDSPNNVKAIVSTYAGRVKGGDFKWTFNNVIDDSSSDVNVALKAAIENYKSTLVSVQDVDNSILADKSVDMIAVDIYPNPFKDQLIIRTEGNVSKVEILSITGVLLLSIEPSYTLDLSSLQAGIYVLNLYNEHVKTQKLIIKD